ncbi:pyrophosphatase PpaX [Paenibacillus sp. D2_2]|uniref:pyrophosphatase PpaX n=1 Tax=Paenibacillus sp. D2_2 TaxID=3073092 RepID=UPI0028155050|nr:pyrophosphatase PpaX [Paenibacillus sp. D2_2]WMT41131.1 pyrophosphatase PpaX [Paenibacillus sp. D2_2]
MIRTVLFDLDGTIVDTNELIITTFMHVIDKHMDKPYTREQIIPYMGMTLEEQLQIFSGQEDVAHMVKEYRSYNNERHDELVREFPHVLEVIRAMHENGIKLGVVTTKIRLTAMRALELFGLRPYMDVIITVEDVQHPKPHAEPILTAMDQLNADPASTLMVGDSAADLKSAQAAGVRSAAVAWSLKGAEELQKYNPDYILNDMTDLYDLVGMGANK